MSTSARPPARHRHRSRPARRLRPRDVAVAMTAVVATGAALALDHGSEESADRSADQVRSADAGPVRPVAPRPPLDGVAADVRQAVVTGTGPSDVYPAALRQERATMRRAQEQYRAARARDQAAAERAARWDRLADCESGHWGADGTPVPGTATWDYGLASGQGGSFQGGLQFHPGTWDQYRPDGSPDHAGAASRELQIAVAERVLADQGWGAWPVCSRKLGYR
jgi:hypothetical protein